MYWLRCTGSDVRKREPWGEAEPPELLLSHPLVRALASLFAELYCSSAGCDVLAPMYWVRCTGSDVLAPMYGLRRTGSDVLAARDGGVEARRGREAWGAAKPPKPLFTEFSWGV